MNSSVAPQSNGQSSQRFSTSGFLSIPASINRLVKRSTEQTMYCVCTLCTKQVVNEKVVTIIHCGSYYCCWCYSFSSRGRGGISNTRKQIAMKTQNLYFFSSVASKNTGTDPTESCQESTQSRGYGTPGCLSSPTPEGRRLATWYFPC